MITVICGILTIAFLQGFNYSLNMRIQAEYEVLKKRIEELERAKNGN